MKGSQRNFMERQRVALVLSITIILLVGTTSAIFFLGMLKDDSALNFYVFGDSQGYQGGLEQIVETANILRPDFLFHCGDLTSLGYEDQYQEVKSVLDQSVVPVYTTIGNHDLKSDGGKYYLEYFGSSSYSFNRGPAHFSIFNTSSGDVSEPELNWLAQDLSAAESEYKFVFTHIPPLDPRPERDHGLVNATTASRLMTLFEEQEVDVVFTGHVHMYNDSVINGVRYVITGGAGASLYADEDEGGIYHYMNVTINDSGLLIEPVLLEDPSIPRDTVIIRGSEEDATLSLKDLLELPSIEGFSSFENQLNNWRGQGVYVGALVSTLIELVGGMSIYDTLVVRSFDGYVQNFSYYNVYPNATWLYIQGPMILAYEYNDTQVLEWDDGMRIVMLPPDGAYSNEDANQTTETGDVVSAGSRWVRFVSIIEVIPG